MTYAGNELGQTGTAVAAGGLTSSEAARRLTEYGPNDLPVERPPPVALALLRQLTHFFALLLWAAAALAAIAGMPQLSIAIIVVIVVNGGFAFVQEYRADRAVDRLRELLPAAATVRRDGQRHRVPVPELVPGDIALLEAGDQVSADLTTLSAAGLAVDESMLTGESVPRRVGVGDGLFAGTLRRGGLGGGTRGGHRRPDEAGRNRHAHPTGPPSDRPARSATASGRDGHRADLSRRRHCPVRSRPSCLGSPRWRASCSPWESPSHWFPRACCRP